MRADCDRRWEIDALREGTLGAKDAEAFERHARACEVCAATVARDARLRQLAASLPESAPNELDVRRLRARILHDVATGAPERRRATAPIAAALAFALLALVSWTVVRRGPSVAGAPLVAAPPVAGTASSPEGWRGPPADAFASTVAPVDGARWSRAREGGTERVRLEDGTLKVHVRHQASGERFLVELPDGEIEVRGTTFEVTVRAGSTERVRVEEGVVAVRVTGLGAELVLQAGETWGASPPAPRPKGDVPAPRGDGRLADHPARGGEATRGPPLVPAKPAGEDGADAYAAAIALMQGGQYSLAASGFRTFVLAHPASPQAEDASFLEAASLARAGRPDAAALAAEDHLARFPKSFHRKEAAILIARAARDRGDCAQARAVLAPWLGSPADADALSTLRRCAEGESEKNDTK